MSEKKRLNPDIELKVEVDGTMFVAWVNTDLTEGRGASIPISHCQSRETAIRNGRGKDVQGSDASIDEVPLLRVGQFQYGPVRVQYPSKSDELADAKNKEREELFARLRRLGITEDELKVLEAGFEEVRSRG